jgi:hypothetical protein
MTPRWLVAPLVLASACFDPTFDHPRCGTDNACPSDLACNSAGICDVISNRCNYPMMSKDTRHYYRVTEVGTWDVERAACEGDGGQLVKIETLAEDNFVTALTPGQTWIGARARSIGKLDYYWTDGTALTAPAYMNWTAPSPSSPAEPMNDTKGDGDCVGKDPSNEGTWVAEPCSASAMAICECDN